MPLKLITAGGGSVILDANTTASTYTINVPPEGGSMLTTGSLTGINASAMSVGTIPISRYASGSVINAATKSWYTYDGGQLEWSGTTAWQAWNVSEFSVVAKRANSLWAVFYTFPIASRSASATSTDIYYKVNSGSYSSLAGHSMYGLGTIWEGGSSDNWNATAIQASIVVSHSAGDTLYFKVYGRKGGPGGDSTSGTAMLGHPGFNGNGFALEIAQ